MFLIYIYIYIFILSFARISPWFCTSIDIAWMRYGPISLSTSFFIFPLMRGIQRSPGWRDIFICLLLPEEALSHPSICVQPTLRMDSTSTGEFNLYAFNLQVSLLRFAGRRFSCAQIFFHSRFLVAPSILCHKASHFQSKIAGSSSAGGELSLRGPRTCTKQPRGPTTRIPDLEVNSFTS